MQPSEGVTSPAFQLGALALVPDLSGALHAPDKRLLIVADLHFEKGSALARRGSMLPPYDSRETLARLAALVLRLKPKTIIALGDTWHDRGGHSRMDSSDEEVFAGLRQGIDWVFIAGNHDPEPPPELKGSAMQEMVLGGVTFRHEPDSRVETPEIAGHLHPAAKVKGRGRSVRRKCFVSNQSRCILPAFGAYTGGLNVLDPAFRPFFSDSGFKAHLIGERRVYGIGPLSLLPD